MSLSTEDSLRLNVLLTQDLKAIRIDESAMVVHALTNKGEVKAPLVPNCRDDVYLKKIREFFSTHALGSPGGYPVYLKRWARMGQTRENNLDRLLILGEPEAVVAVAHATGISEQLAIYTWWAMPTADVARRLLENKVVVESTLGKELAAYLLDYMPFETEALAIIENVRLILQPNLVSEEIRLDLWSKAGRKTVFYVGFLQALPDVLPSEVAANPVLEQAQLKLSPLLAQGDPYVLQLCRLLSAPGQMYLTVLNKAVSKLTNQDMTVALLKAMEEYFVSVCPEQYRGVRDIAELNKKQQTRIASEDYIELVSKLPELEKYLSAMMSLSMVGESIINPVFAQTDAMGSVMRKKLTPVIEPVQEYIHCLLN